MNTAAFLIAVRRQTHTTSPHPDPLAVAWRFLDEHGQTAEGQALRRVIKALAAKDGAFSESEVWLFSADTLPLIATLVEARLEGRYSEIEWWAA